MGKAKENELKRRIEGVRELSKIQSSPGNYDYSEYMRGMANGLIIAEAILYNTDPVFFEPLENNKIFHKISVPKK